MLKNIRGLLDLTKIHNILVVTYFSHLFEVVTFFHRQYSYFEVPIKIH
jgi:hypothetical protein